MWECRIAIMANAQRGRARSIGTLKLGRLCLFFEWVVWVSNPSVEPVEYEQEDENDQPQIGQATFLLSKALLLVDFSEAMTVNTFR
jgi:hypothetical protein